MDLLSLHKKNRERALEEARDLLWENIEGSLYWFGNDIQSEPEKSKAKLKVQWHHYHPTLVSLLTSFSGTVDALETNDVKRILQYGAARRIFSIYRWAKVICDLAYPDRVDVLTQEESRELSDALMVIYVHMIGVFDAIAIALERINDGSTKNDEKYADLLRPKFRKAVDFVSLETLFKDNDRWFRRVKEELRNRYVHRVPPYVAPAVWSQNDVTENNKLQVFLNDAMNNGDLVKIDEVMALQAGLGKFSPFICFTDSDELMNLLPTILDDLFRFQFISLTVLEELVPRLSFRSLQSAPIS